LDPAGEPPELWNARKTLLEHYTHQLTSHYGYLWTVALANATLLTIAGIFRPLTFGMTISIQVGPLAIGPYGIPLVEIDLLALGLGFLSGAAVWIFLKCLFYGVCCRSVLWMTPSPPSEGPNMLKRLDFAVSRQNWRVQIMQNAYAVLIGFFALWILFTLFWQSLTSLGIIVLRKAI